MFIKYSGQGRPSAHRRVVPCLEQGTDGDLRSATPPKRELLSGTKARGRRYNGDLGQRDKEGV